jgi:hypothetical protein
MKKSIEERILELITEDKELHDAIVAHLKAQTEAALALADYRRRRIT